MALLIIAFTERLCDCLVLCFIAAYMRHPDDTVVTNYNCIAPAKSHKLICAAAFARISIMHVSVRTILVSPSMISDVLSPPSSVPLHYFSCSIFLW